MNKKDNTIDFLAIGDITTDAFIKLKDAHVHCNINHNTCELCLRFKDKIPYESVTVIPAHGNSANATVSASRLGLKSAIVTNIGDDQNGLACLTSLKKEKINTNFVKIEKKKETNYHYVLCYDKERTILVKHTNFDYHFPKIKNNVSWVYLSSLSDHSLKYHEEIKKYLKNNPKIKLAFQPGTFQIKIGTEKLKEIYAQTEVFFCNLEEAGRILKTDSKNVLELSKGIHKLGAKIISLTDGENGAYLYTENNLYHIPKFSSKIPVLESTGAGDAFSSTFVSALILGKSPIEALALAPINSMSVIRHIGAQEGLLSLKELEKYLKSAPRDYKIKKLN